MKVAIVAYGHADNVLCLAKNLSQYVDLTLFFVTSGNSFTRSIFDWDISGLPYGLTRDSAVVDGYLGNQVVDYIRPNLRTYLVRTPSENPFRDWHGVNYGYVKEVSQFIIDESYDVVHFNGASGLHVYLNHLLNRLPKVYTIHDYLPHTGDTNVKGFVVNTLFNTLFTRNNYEFIQHYEYLSNRFSSFYGVNSNHVHTVYCGPLEIYKSFAQGKLKEDPYTVLYFGRISPYKGIDYLFRAAPILRKRIPEIKIVVAGKGKFWFEFENTKPFEVYNYHISNLQLVTLLQKATVVVAPYIDATHSAVIMTAYAFGKPVVASAVGGIPEVVENGITGLLVPRKNPRALADALTDLLADSKKRNTMKANIKRIASQGKISWQRIASDTIDVYKYAIARHNRP